MTSHTKIITGKLLLSLIGILTIVAPFLADWNVTHIYNPAWPPHAKFHNAQTMALAVLLGMATLFYTWKAGSSRTNLLPALLFAGFYWISQVLAFSFPGAAWTDPNLLQAGQALTDMPLQLKGDAVLLPVILLAGWFIWQGETQPETR